MFCVSRRVQADLAILEAWEYANIRQLLTFAYHTLFSVFGTLLSSRNNCSECTNGLCRTNVFADDYGKLTREVDWLHRPTLTNWSTWYVLKTVSFLAFSLGASKQHASGLAAANKFDCHTVYNEN